MNNKITILNQENINYFILNEKKLLLIDFWASWCNPCKIISPILEEVSIELFDKIKIAKINIDENPKIIKNFLIRSIPTIIIFKNKKALATKTGTFTNKELKEFIKPYLI